MDVNCEPDKLDDSSWDDLINFIKEGKCILFVGPESVMKSPGILYHSELIKSPEFQNNEYFKYIERDEMFLLNKNFYRGKLVSRFRNYCNKNIFFDDTYKKISAIPFNTIIVVTRYSFLLQTFENNKIAFQHRWFSKIFDKSKTEAEIDTPSSEIPLIYNLFGNSNTDESLLLTHNDLFDYLTKLLSENSLPARLRELVKSSNQIIFLGFKFERWYLQLLLRLFELNDLNAKFERIATTSHEQEDIINMCTTDFNMNFIGENSESFVNTLYDKCIEKGVELRKPSSISTGSLLRNEFNSLLKTNRFDDALKQLENLEIKNNLQDKVTQLTGSWNSIKSKKENGTISDADLNLETNKFRQQMQLVIDDHLAEVNNS